METSENIIATSHLAESLVNAIESSKYAPPYYNRRRKLIRDIAKTIVENFGAIDSDINITFLDSVENHLNNDKVWIRISACIKFPDAIDKNLNYHTLYHAARKGYVNAKEDEEGWLIEENSFLTWLRTYPYGAYGGKG